MSNGFYRHLTEQLNQVQAEGLYKQERIITSAQQASIAVGGEQVLNFCANNYLGLANHPDSDRCRPSGARQPRLRHGLGALHLWHPGSAQSAGAEDVCLPRHRRYHPLLLLFRCQRRSFETLFGAEDAIISDALNHASIIDGVRLCKAKRYRYANNDMAELEAQLKQADADGARFKLIATDGVFSMDGVIADLKSICDLADKYDALVMVDDSHAVGFIGENGRGTHEYCGVMDWVDIITGTLGKALGGASGGYTSGKKEVIDWLRQRSRPYLFSNSLAPSIVSATIKVIDMLAEGHDLRARLKENSRYFRERMSAAGFTLAGADHAIIPVMLGDAKLASEMASRMLAAGIYVVGFSFPVVPKGQARIRTQMSAAHTREQLDKAIDAFIRIGRELGVI